MKRREIVVWEEGSWVDKSDYEKVGADAGIDDEMLFAFFDIPDSCDDWINDNIDYFVEVLINGVDYQDDNFIDAWN